MNRSRIIPILRWTARIIGTLVVLLIAGLAIGEGIPNPLHQPAVVNILSVALITIIAGQVIAWKHEGIGGALIIAGFLCFAAIGHGVLLNAAFSPMLITGTLYLICFLGQGNGKVRRVLLWTVVAGAVVNIAMIGWQYHKKIEWSGLRLYAMILPSHRAGIESYLHVAEWQDDLEYLKTKLPQKQIDFYKLMPKEKFEREISDINQSVPRLSDSQITLRLIRLMAGLGVAHSVIYPPGKSALAFHYYPLQFTWFSDGLVVTASAPGDENYEKALGARVVRFGTMTPEEVETGLAPYISYENKVWLHSESARCMRIEELLQSLDIADGNGRMELTLAKPDGTTFPLDVSPAETGPILVPGADTLHIPKPLYRKHDDNYWYEYLPDTGTLYIQYRVCQNDLKNPFANFAKDLFAFADSHHIERTVVDLRLNGGGDSEVVTPLVNGIRPRPALNSRGRLFVLIGPRTFSSGELAVEEFHNTFSSMTHKSVDGFLWFYPNPSSPPRTQFNAIFIGEPTGGKPNCYGEVHTFALPNSGLMVQYAVKHFQLISDGDPPSREPDLIVTHSWADYLAGRDAVMDAVLKYH